MDASGVHGGVFVFCGALASADDGAGVAHAAARRSGLPGDETDDRFFYVDLDPFGGAFFGVATDFADQNDGVSVGIFVEHFDGIEKRRADDGIAADADASGLADAEFGELVHGFIGQRAAAADDADVSLLVDAPGHNADFAFAGRDYTGTIRSNEATLGSSENIGDTDHVQRGNAFGDADDERHLRVGGFENGVGRIRWRNENDGSIRARSFHRFGDRVEYRALEMFASAFAGSHTANDVCSVLNHLLSVKSSFAAGKSLN